MAQQTMAQEKAVELFKKYYCLSNNSKSKLKVIEYETAKQCALIAVDEILESEPRYPSEVDWDDCGGTHEYYGVAQREEAEKFWQEVKQEINKL